MKNILVCVDLTANSEHLISESVQFARAFDAKVYVNFVAPLSDRGNGYSMVDIEVDWPDECKVLNALASQIRQEGVDAHAILATGNPTDEILEEVKKLNIDFIMLGAHRRGVAPTRLLKNVSQSIVSKSLVPVCIVPKSIEIV
jgi:nucleotide-binding universal stress UspA family protein